MLSTTIAEIEDVFSEMMTGLLSKDKGIGEAVEDVILLQARGNDTRFEDDKESAEHAEKEIIDDPEEVKKSQPLFASSIWHKHFSRKMTTLLEKVGMSAYEYDAAAKQDKSCENPLFSPEYARHIMKFYIPYIPFWTAVIVIKVIPNFERQSNVVAESYFNQLKNVLFQGKGKMNALYVMEMLRINASDRVKQTRLRSIGVQLVDYEASRKRRKKKAENPKPKKQKTTVENSRKKPPSSKKSELVDNPENKNASVVWDRTTVKEKSRRKHDTGMPLAVTAKNVREGRAQREAEKKISFALDTAAIDADQRPSCSFKAAETQENLPNIQYSQSDQKKPSQSISDKSKLSAQQSLYSEHECAMPNGLFPDLAYYWGPSLGHLPICRFRTNSPCFPFYGFEEVAVNSSHFKSLRSGRWVDTQIVDAYVLSHVESWTNVFILPLGHGNNLF